MRKKFFRTSLAACLVFAVACLAVACGVNTPIDNNNVGNTIKGGVRPDYDSMFDFESGFTESVVSDINTLTIQSDKVTFTGGAKTASVTKSEPMPEVVNGNTGFDIAGWYNVNDYTSVWNQTPYVLRSSGATLMSFTMPARATTVAPFFVKEGQRPLIAASQAIDTNSSLAARDVGKIFETEIGAQIGSEITYKGGIYSGTPGSSLSGNNGYFRMLTSCASDKTSTGAIAVGEHIFNYWFKNLGDETVKFKVYQGSSGLNIYAGANTAEITLAAGDTWSGSVTIDIASANANALTFLVFSTNHTANNAKLAMTMSKSTANHVA